MCTVLGGQPFKVASHEHRPQLVLVGNVELIAAWMIPFSDFLGIWIYRRRRLGYELRTNCSPAFEPSRV
jgi:hypothetical protein